MTFPNLFNDRFSLTSEPEVSTGSNRRNFLKTLGIIGAGVALAPTGVLAKPFKTILNPSPNAAWLASCDDYRSCVQQFVEAIAASNPALARRIIAELDASEIDQAPRYRGFHYRYAPLHAFRRKLDREEVICGNGFMVDLFPYYGVDCTCPSYYDMNGREMARVRNAREMAFYGCVLAPAGERTEPTRADHANYEELLATHYRNHNPDHFKLGYTRDMVSVNTGKRYKAYGINYTKYDDSNTETGDVLISKNV